jgi:hypothetical protein
VLLSIEDKAWAAPQDKQGDRHKKFVLASDKHWPYAVIVAPRAWLQGHSVEAAIFDIRISLEDLAGWCRHHSPTLDFRARVFEQACEPPSAGVPADDLQVWNQRIDAILDAEHGLRLAPTVHIRTTKQGLARAGRFINCAIDTLSPIPGVGQPWLRLKTTSPSRHARADIEVARAPLPFIDAVKAAAVGAGFPVRLTAAGTLIVTKYAVGAEGFTTGPIDEKQEATIRIVCATARDLCDWWRAITPTLSWA